MARSWFVRLAFIFGLVFTLSWAEQVPASAEVYTYVSRDYGYSIDCPQKPLGVLPASVLYPNEKGEVLVFANDGYKINKAWLILTDAFPADELPNLDKLTEKGTRKLLDKLRQSGSYAYVDIIPLSGKKKGLFEVTSKEIEIDTDGDGKPDTKATADTQMALTFFRGEKGTRYAIELIDNPELTQANIDEYRAGMSTFKELH